MLNISSNGFSTEIKKGSGGKKIILYFATKKESNLIGNM